MARRGRMTPGGPTQPRSFSMGMAGPAALPFAPGGKALAATNPTGPSSKLGTPQAKVGKLANRIDAKLAKPGQAVGDWGARRNLGGPTGRIASMQQGYENALGYTQPGARGLLAAMSGSFGGEIDDDTKMIVNLRQAGLGGGDRSATANLGSRL